jgi:hypothetical protein
MKTGIVERVMGPDGQAVEIIVKAPVAEMQMAAAELNRDPPTEAEIAEAAMVVAQEEHDEANLQKLAGSTISTVTVALALMLLRGVVEVRTRGIDGAEILISREMIDRATGAKLGISETADHDVILRWRTRAERPIEPEEMRLDA